MRPALLIAALALAACEAPADDANLGIGGQAAVQPAAPPNDLPAYFDCLRQSGHVADSAHRGGPTSGFAENALPTFENTRRQAPGSFLEVDIARTADGVLVLMHDDRIERTTTGTGAVAELDMDALLQFSLEDANGDAVDATVPSLWEALVWADGRVILELDIKSGVRFEDVIADVEFAGAMSRVVFITYSIDAASRLARLAPQAMIYTTISSARELDVLERRGVDLSHIVAWTGTSTPNRDLVESLAARGVETRFGMFGDGRDYASAARAGAQIVATDDAPEAVRDLDAADGEEGYAALRCAAGA